MEDLEGCNLRRKLEVLRFLPPQNESLLHRVRSQSLQNLLPSELLKLTIRPTGIHYLLVISVNHDKLFGHCDLMEVHHIIEVDSCKHKFNYECQYTCVNIINSPSEVRLRDHGLCVCNQVPSVLLSQAR
jgi:hypothetical protein